MAWEEDGEVGFFFDQRMDREADKLLDHTEKEGHLFKYFKTAEVEKTFKNAIINKNE